MKAQGGASSSDLALLEQLTADTWGYCIGDRNYWQTVYDYFRKWHKDGLWEDIHTALREQTRVQAGRNATPSATVIDSQSVKATEKGGPERGYDGAKKIQGRKRHILVDTTGLVLKAHVHAADVTDRDGAKLLLESVKGVFPRLSYIWAIEEQ